MEDERLIELVRENGELFDMSHRKYVDNVWKTRIWAEIGKQLGQGSKKCKSRWESLRGQYRKYIRTAGQPANSSTKFKFSDEMSFLRPHIKDKKRFTSVLNEYKPEFDPDDIGQLHPNDSTPFERFEPVEGLSVETLPPRSPTSSSISWGRSHPKRRKYEEISSSILMKHVLEAEKHSQEKKFDDEISHFFSSMEASFRKFSCLEQLQAKQQIFNIITGIEMNKYQNQNHQTLTLDPIYICKKENSATIPDDTDETYSEPNSVASYSSAFSPDL